MRSSLRSQVLHVYHIYGEVEASGCAPLISKSRNPHLSDPVHYYKVFVWHTASFPYFLILPSKTTKLSNDFSSLHVSLTHSSLPSFMNKSPFSSVATVLHWDCLVAYRKTKSNHAFELTCRMFNIFLFHNLYNWWWVVRSLTRLLLVYWFPFFHPDPFLSCTYKYPLIFYSRHQIVFATVSLKAV